MEGTQSVAELARDLEATKVALNFVWVLIAAFMVMLMQAGFAMVETGLVRAKNVGHTMAMNFLVYCVGMLGYWAVGFGLQMGGVGELASLGGDATLNAEYSISLGGRAFGVFGMKGFFLPPHVFTSSVAVLFIFQMVFMDTTATIPTGALAERWKFSSFVIFSFIVATLIYPLYGNWVWGGGFLAQLGTNFGLGHGHVDFAGSSVVHMTGGVIALVAAKVVGARIGKFGPDGEPRPIPGHNLPMVVTGAFILAFGWFGFNAGSTLAGTDARIGVVAVNTMLASAAGAFAAYLYTKHKFGLPDLSMMCNGLLAGLVAITAPCAFVGASTAVLIGAIAGVLVIEAALYVERGLRLDDPVGAIAVHGVNGVWGILCVGLFADGTYGHGLNGVHGGVRGLFYGDPKQLAASVIGIAVNLLWVAPTTMLALKVIDRLVGNRSSIEDEMTGLDVPEFGIPGYAGETGETCELASDEFEELDTRSIPEVLRG